MPELLQAPKGANMVDCHGLAVDADNNIILTYHNDGTTKDQNCLIKWKPDGTDGEFLTGGGTALCSGTAHGLKITTEGPGGKPAVPGVPTSQFLYHANNNQKLTKTTLDGTIVWQRNGYFGQDPSLPYRPTWFATPPNSKHVYLCDGYGSNNVYVFDRSGRGSSRRARRARAAGRRTGSSTCLARRRTASPPPRCRRPEATRCSTGGRASTP